MTAQFLTFVPHGEKTLWRKFLLRRGQRNFRFSVSPFSSRGNKHIFSFYPSTLETAELCFETTASHSTIIWSAWLFRFSPFSRSRHRLCQRAAPNTPFALRGHVTSFFMKMKFIWFCLRKTISGSYLKQNNGDLVFQTRTIFLEWVSSKLVTWPKWDV